MMNIRFLNKHFDNQQLRPWLSICLSFLFLLSCTTTPSLTLKQDSPVQSKVTEKPEVIEKKQALRLSKSITASTSVVSDKFQLKGEDELRFDLPLALPVVRSGIKTGSGTLQLSSGADGWHPAGLVTAFAAVHRLPNGNISLSLEAGKYSGATTFYINAAAIVPGNPDLKKGETVTGNIDTNARYTISNDNGTAPLRYYDFDSGSLSATVNEDNVSVKLSGITASKLTQIQCFSWGSGSSCDTTTDPNNKVLSGEIEFLIPITNSSLGLQLKASQDAVGNEFTTSTGTNSQSSVLDIDTFGAQEPWTLHLQKENVNGGSSSENTCWTSQTLNGSGTRQGVFSLDASQLANGKYNIEAYYSAYPDKKAQLTVDVKNKVLVEVIENQSFIPIKENTKLKVLAPACVGDWTLKFTGKVHNPESPDVPSQCIFNRTGPSDPLQPSSVLWNGICETLTARGDWDVELTAGDESDSTMVIALESGGVELEVDEEAISPENGDGHLDKATFSIQSNTGKPWELKIQGYTIGPDDERGLPTKGDECTWSVTGEEEEKEVPWSGLCDVGGPMIDGQYTATLSSAGKEDTASIMVDNTAPIVSNIEILENEDSIDVRAKVTDPLVNGVASGIDTNSAGIEVAINGESVQIASGGISSGFQTASSGGDYTVAVNIQSPTSNNTNGDAVYIGIPDNVKNKGKANKDLTLELQLDISPMEVAPLKDKQSSAAAATKSQVIVTVKRGESPAKDISVDIEAKQPRSGYHDHPNGDKGNRPYGVFFESGSQKITRKTDANGKILLNYRNSGFSGIEEIVAKLATDSSKVKSKEITVKLGGLIELVGSSYYDLGGNTSPVGQNHPKNHFGTPELVSMLKKSSETFFKATNKKIYVNDMSLPWGGPFEFEGNWNLYRRHQNHREGNNADIASYNLKDTRSRRAFELAVRKEKWEPWLEDAFHYHIYR